jgi:hypothetical protein
MHPILLSCIIMLLKNEFCSVHARHFIFCLNDVYKPAVSWPSLINSKKKKKKKTARENLCTTTQCIQCTEQAGPEVTL